MYDPRPFREYIQRLNDSLSLGNATEHTHRSALKALLEAVHDGTTATNEPRRIECGAPDFAVTQAGPNPLMVGYVEAKDIGTGLDQIEQDSNRAKPATVNGSQLKRYRRSLSNLVLTDYAEFRWYVDGQSISATKLAEYDGSGRLTADRSGLEETGTLLSDFLQRTPDPVSTPEELAGRMARPTHMISDIVAEGLRRGRISADLSDLYKAMRDVLVPDLTIETFADMFAQTLAYGLFAARVNHESGTFTRADAAARIPRTNPFVRRMFGIIAGPDLDDEPFVSFVDDLAQLLSNADMEAILSGFGQRAARQDPVMHFYESFLAAYDPALREQRGVYYTPEPVVSYIVRSVDHILRERFDCAEGLADRGMTTYETSDSEGNVTQHESHRVLVLDPACGSGTFLYAVVDHIREYYRGSGNAGMWGGYVKNHLIKRLFGFELIMAAYAMAHLKLGMQLAAHDMPPQHRAQWAYEFAGGERLGVYLTNTLEQAERETMTLFGPMRVIMEEANAAAEIKRDLPIMVVLGNPPYSGHSANKGEWISDLIDSYKRDFPELRKPAQAKWLSDDYVKFIRFAQWRIEKSGNGILAFITNHSYLDNPTFRGMRLRLMETFDEIYLLDLHGNAKKKERAPDGGLDQNVFDIQQGVAIAIFIRCKDTQGKLARVFHTDLWGEREAGASGGKYSWLSENSIDTTEWNALSPKAPMYLFIPRDEELLDEYEAGWAIPDIFSQNCRPAPGIVTTHDQFAISWTQEEAESKVERLLATASEEEARSIWRLCSQKQWQYDRAKRELADGSWRNYVEPILYRPFDVRYTVLDRNVAVHRRERVMRHILARENVGLIFMRQVALHDAYSHFGVSQAIVDNRAFYSNKGIMSFAPLYTYPSEQEVKQGLYRSGDREPNLSPKFVENLEKGLGLRFVNDGRGDLHETFGPEDVFHYIYAVFHSPTYRERYDQFLRADFPRVPLTDDVELFRALAGLGRQLTAVHLMEAPSLNQAQVSFPVSGDNVIEKGHPKYYGPGDTPPGERSPVERGRTYISKNNRRSGKQGQYFEGIAPDVWEFRVGGYQPLNKWVKDRRGRTLSFEDLDHYRRIAAALRETIHLMDEIDRAIADSGLIVKPCAHAEV